MAKKENVVVNNEDAAIKIALHYFEKRLIA